MSEFKELQTILIFNVVHVNWQDVLSYITVDQTCKYSLDNVFSTLLALDRSISSWVPGNTRFSSGYDKKVRAARPEECSRLVAICIMVFHCLLTGNSHRSHTHKDHAGTGIRLFINFKVVAKNTGAIVFRYWLSKVRQVSPR
jgi:hypothetical protein